MHYEYPEHIMESEQEKQKKKLYNPTNMCCFTNLKPSIKELKPGRSTYRWDRDTRSLKEPSGTLEISFPWSVLEWGEAGRY